MIKVQLSTVFGTPLVVFGLSMENLRRLMADDPIKFPFSECGILGPGEIIIMAGEDEQDILEQLRAAGIKIPSMPAAGPGETFHYRGQA